jgi:hypothetical protein
MMRLNPRKGNKNKGQTPPAAAAAAAVAASGGPGAAVTAAAPAVGVKVGSKYRTVRERTAVGGQCLTRF